MWKKLSVSHILFVFLLLGYLLFALVPEHPILDGDSPEYLDATTQVCQGQGLKMSDGGPVLYRPPGYIWLAGSFSRLIENCGNPRAQYIFNAIVLWLAVVVLSISFRRLGQGWIAWMFALHPSVFSFIGYVMSECLLVLVAALMFFAFCHLLRPERFQKTATWLGFGALTGVIGLVRPTYLPAGVALVLVAAWARRASSFQVIQKLALMSLAIALVVLPYSLRNHRITGRWILINSQGSLLFFASTVSSRIPNWNQMPEYIEARGEAERQGVSVDKYMSELAWKNLAQNPTRYLRNTLERAGLMIAPPREYAITKGWVDVGSRSLLYLVFFGLQAVGYLLALFGTIQVFLAREKNFYLVGAAVLGWSQWLIYVLLIAVPRYQIPLFPYFFLLAAFGITSLINMPKKSTLVVR